MMRPRLRRIYRCLKADAEGLDFGVEVSGFLIGKSGLFVFADLIRDFFALAGDSGLGPE